MSKTQTQTQATLLPSERVLVLHPKNASLATVSLQKPKRSWLRNPFKRLHKEPTTFQKCLAVHMYHANGGRK